MTIIIYILGLTVSMYAFSLCFPKAYKEAPYWKRFFCLISTKITNYYFKTTPGKICLWIIRANSAAYTLYTFGLPIIEAGKTRESYWVCLQWEEPNLYAFLVYLFINGIIGVIYFRTQRYGGKEIKEDLSRQENLIKENASKLNKIDENTEENNQLLKSLLGTVPDTYQSILISSVKTTINDIKNLNF